MDYSKAKSVKELFINKKSYKYCSLKDLKGTNIQKLPFSIRILLENVLRNFNGSSITEEHIKNLTTWTPDIGEKEIPYNPARILMQDFTGVPAVVDIASLRSEFVRHGGDGKKISPAIPVDLIIDHSVQVDYYGTNYAMIKNVEKEYERNTERYELLKWAQNGLKGMTVVPPGMGICHQVNLEYLAKGVQEREGWLYPDTLVGTDSHTPMVNGIGVVGWGVGGIEAEAALLGQPIYFPCPKVIGLKLTGKLEEGITSTDMVLTITELLRSHGVVGTFVEVFGDGLDRLSVPDRATIANMSPEFGCTITFFPIDHQTIDYMDRTNRPKEHLEMVELYCKTNLLWRDEKEETNYTEVLELDLSKLEPTLSGPKLPQEKILAKNLNPRFQELMLDVHGRGYIPVKERQVWYDEGGSGTAFTKD